MSIAVGKPKVNYVSMSEAEAAKYLCSVQPTHVSRLSEGDYKYYSALLPNGFIKGDKGGFVVYRDDGTPMTVVQIRS